MAEEHIDSIIKEHYATLPEPVKKAVASFDWAREVFDIGRKHSLHIDKIGELQTEVMLVVLGLTSPRQFEDELLERIEPDRDKAFEISDEVNTKVFLRIRDFMKNYYEQGGVYAPPEKEDEIKSADRTVLHSAGIKLGDEPDEPQAAPADDEFVSLVSPDEIETPAPAPNAVAAIQETVSKPKVFVSPVPSVAAKPLAKNYLDPYREPIE